MKKHIYTYIILLFTTIGSVNAQDYFSFYNLGDYVAQTQNVSPVYLPKNSFTFGTPLNVGMNLKSNLTLSNILVDNGSGGLKIDFDGLNESSEEINKINSDVTANIFMLAFKTKKGSLTVFANLRSTLNWQYSDDFTNVAANGFGASFALSDDKMRSSSYSEIGIGYTRKFLKDRLAVGLRLKSLNGITHSETAENSSLSVDIDQTTSYWTVMASNATVNTSGLEEDENGDRSFFTGNKGFGFDIGATYAITPKLTVELAVNDIGSIDWSENVKNYNIADTDGAVFQGGDLNTEGSIEDELTSALEDVIGTSETTESFKTKLSTKTYISAKYQLTEKNALTAAFFKKSNTLIDVKASYALGFNRTLNKTTYGVVASAGGPNSDMRFGANVVLRLGFLQLYAATDNIANLAGKIEDTNGGTVRVGLNFVFGYNKWIKK
ncbi:DUF5723 family protein [Flavicella sediminum]|uniref:DUF5723 family protein n=1 Tax=Flavicella sediminum TaxID=2585141 RepID=UPI00112183B4|nr:DUF5723 family protein [Flavicella sediminum]